MQKLDDIGDSGAPHGSREWCAALRLHTQSRINNAKSCVSHLRFDLKAFRDSRYYEALQDKQGESFATWEDFCQYPRPFGLGFNAEVANAIIEEADGNKLVSTVAAETMANAKAIGKQGRPKGEDKGRLPTINGERNAAYLAARIKRDRPDIAALVESGDIDTMAEAAQMAGIPIQKVIRLSDPSKVARKIIAQGEDYARRVAAEILDGLRLAA